MGQRSLRGSVRWSSLLPPSDSVIAVGRIPKLNLIISCVSTSSRPSCLLSRTTAGLLSRYACTEGIRQRALTIDSVSFQLRRPRWSTGPSHGTAWHLCYFTECIALHRGDRMLCHGIACTTLCLRLQHPSSSAILLTVFTKFDCESSYVHTSLDDRLTQHAVRYNHGLLPLGASAVSSKLRSFQRPALRKCSSSSEITDRDQETSVHFLRMTLHRPETMKSSRRQ